MKNDILWGMTAVAVLAGWLAGCSTAKVTGEESFATARPTVKPVMIYVADFELQAQDIKEEKGLLPRPEPGPLRRLLPGAKKDPDARAHELVSLMSESILKNLHKAGFDAIRLPPDTTLPINGWLIRGVFTEVQEGNRLRRAMIGFGSGATDLQVVTSADNLSDGLPKPLYKIDTEASSKAPGAAPTLLIGPYGAIARFVIAGKDLERNVKQTGEKIAEGVAKQVQASKG